MDTPCEGWAPVHDLCSAWATASAAQQAYADRLAIRVLWAATGRRFGLCETTVRPCWTPQAPLYQTFPVGYHGEGFWSLQGVAGGVVLSGVGCGCEGGCRCRPPEVALPGPIASVSEVLIDGVVFDPGSYRVDLGSYLVRTDGLSWPAPQDLALASSEVGTWEITYDRGLAVPDDIQDAAGLYACEVVRGLVTGSCHLPARVQSITRSGVDIRYVEDDEYLDKGRTGYQAVDQLIVTYNPNGLPSRTRFLSPDLPMMR